MNAPLPAQPKFQPQDPAFAARVRASFARQKAMVLIGATLTVVEPGCVEIALAYRPELTQQKAFVHGGILGMIADSACGYAARGGGNFFRLRHARPFPVPPGSNVVPVDARLSPGEGGAPDRRTKGE